MGAIRYLLRKTVVFTQLQACLCVCSLGWPAAFGGRWVRYLYSSGDVCSKSFDAFRIQHVELREFMFSPLYDLDGKQYDILEVTHLSFALPR